MYLLMMCAEPETSKIDFHICKMPYIDFSHYEANSICIFVSVTPNKRLTFMYLANDVIQNSKKKGPEFTRDFGSILADAFRVGIK